MTTVRLARSLLAVAAIAPASLVAQSAGKRVEIPAAYKPPAGMCRVWVDAVPPDKQPAPTDCSAALKNKPANGRVLFGESPASTKGGRPALMSRTLTPALPRGSATQSTSRPAPVVAPPVREASKSGRDTSKRGHDSTVKKPPPQGR